MTTETAGSEVAFVIWFSGPPASGKSTLALAVSEELGRRSVQHELIDGDEVRAFFEDDLGYSRRDRTANIKRIAFAAGLLARHGVTALVANIAPYDELRKWIRHRVDRFCLVHMAVSPEICRSRDVKGVYRSAQPVIGRDEPYEVPSDAEITISSELSPDEAARRVLKFLEARTAA